MTRLIKTAVWCSLFILSDPHKQATLKNSIKPAVWCCLFICKWLALFETMDSSTETSSVLNFLSKNNLIQINSNLSVNFPGRLTSTVVIYLVWLITRNFVHPVRVEFAINCDRHIGIN